MDDLQWKQAVARVIERMIALSGLDTIDKEDLKMICSVLLVKLPVADTPAPSPNPGAAKKTTRRAS